MSALTYPARFIAGEDGRILVEFIDPPRFATDGKDDREAMEEAIDALGSDLSNRLSRKEEIPAPSAAKPGQALSPSAALVGAETGVVPGDASPARQQL
jgi:predicted RNase H-like HicB family nuclease